MSFEEQTPPEHRGYMQQAVEAACQNLQRPFGALLVDAREGEVISSAVNRSYRNPVAHSELVVIGEAARRIAGGVRWADCVLYVTAEPCPMCMTGILWAGIPKVVFGSSVVTLRDLGYRHIDLRAEEVVRRGRGALACELIGGVMEEECDALFAAAIKLEQNEKV